MRLRVTQEELCESLRSLVETGRTEMALRTVRRMIEDIHDQHAWVELRASLEISLGCTTVGHEPWLATYARVLRGCRDAAKILDLTRATVNQIGRAHV